MVQSHYKSLKIFTLKARERKHLKKNNIMNEKTKKTLTKSLVAGLLSALAVIAAAIGLTSCNVTRVVTNQSEYYQKGDTSVCITTKIIETYDASKKNM